MMDYVADYRKQIKEARDSFELEMILEDATKNDYINGEEYWLIFNKAVERVKELTE